MAQRLLLDTNVLVDFFRRHPAAVQFLSEIRARPVISAVTVAEFFAGVREGHEREEFEEFLRRAIVQEVDERVATDAGLFLRQFHKGHGVGLADALIAAGARAAGATLVTLNIKHFPMLQDVLVPYQKA